MNCFNEFNKCIPRKTTHYVLGTTKHNNIMPLAIKRKIIIVGYTWSQFSIIIYNIVSNNDIIFYILYWNLPLLRESVISSLKIAGISNDGKFSSLKVLACAEAQKQIIWYRLVLLGAVIK